MKITDERITELQRLEQAATPVPWEARSLDSPCVIHVSHDEVNRRVTAFVAACSSSTLENSDNAVLIAALRNAAPALLDELERLRKIEAAAALVTKLNLANICGIVAHKPLRHPLCGHCRLAARIEELAAALEGK